VFLGFTPTSEVIDRNAVNHVYRNRITYFISKSVSVFYYAFTYLANGAAERYVNDDDDSRIKIMIEKVVVLSISVFIFFSVIIYGSSTAAGFVESLNPHGPE